MARTVLPIVGAVVGAYFGAPQIGYAIGAVIGNAVDPLKVQGPKIGETGAQTTAEGVPRPIIYGTISCTGNVIVAGPLVIREEETQEGKGGGPVTTSERCFRTYAIRIAEGPLTAVLRIWEDEKLVYDVRIDSTIFAESAKWAAGTSIYLGTEAQLPDPALEVVNQDMPAYRGTAYMVFDGRDLTDRRGSIPQYRFEVSSSGVTGFGDLTNTTTVPSPASHYYTAGIYKGSDGKLGVGYWGSSVAPNWSGVRPYYLTRYDRDLTVISTSPVYLSGAHAGQVLPRAFSDARMIAVDDGGGTVGDTYGSCMVITNGILQANLVPAGYPQSWWNISGSAPWESDGQRVWIGETLLYVGTIRRNSTNYNNLGVWSIGASGPSAAPLALVGSICVTPGQPFFTHLGNDGKFRVINDVLTLTTYSALLVVESSVTVPSGLVGFNGFGVDGQYIVFAYGSPTSRIEIRNLSDFSLIKTISDASFGESRNTRFIFCDNSCFVQCGLQIARIEYGASGGGVILGDIVADISDRCELTPDKFDVSELTDEVAGLLLAGDYTGADAINTLRSPYFFDAYNADKKLWFPKRGADASFVIDIDDLIDDPDVSKREQAIEYPKKVHLQYQHANSGYAVVKATSARSSPDARVVGEMTLSVPIVLDENQAAQTAAKIHKVAWAEADGEIELSLPDSFIQYTPTDVGSVTLRGQTTRRRIDSWDYADGVVKWKMKKDRQSAYTSDVEGVPVPNPTPPPGTITGDTVLAVMDIPSRTDTEDDLNIYYGVTGAMPAWYGAMVQRSVDGGANYSNIVSINQASIIGYITGSVADASESYTDTTNTITVTLYRDGQSIESITNTQFLSEGGAFALEKDDGSWEIMQYRDAVETSSGDFLLSHLHRGLLNSGTSSHSDGALLVMLDRPTHIQMPSSLIGVDLTHRAPSFDQSPELADEQTDTYVGRSQIEWPVAYLDLDRSGSNISATWTPRHRFGTDDNPVASINFQGYRVTIDGGSNGSVTFDTTTAGFTNYDATSLGGGLTVTVSALNRITGAGPITSGTI